MTTCRNERRLLRTYYPPPKQIVDDIDFSFINHRPTDLISDAVLRKVHPSLLEGFIPLSVEGDGNCFYRSSSLALYGTEEHHAYLRILAALEIMEQ